MTKKSPVNVESLPEVFVSDKGMTSTVSKAVQAGRLRKLASRLYTKNLEDPPENIVKRHWHSLLMEYFPDALISDRTALENRPSPDGSVFIISSAKGNKALPGITFKPRKGPPPLDSDRLFLGGVRLSSTARAWLENMRTTRGLSGSDARTFPKIELEERLDAILRLRGDDGLNQMRDEARVISHQLAMEKEFKLLDNLIAGLFGTREAKLDSNVGQARTRGQPYDPARLELFLKLFEKLQATAPITRPAGKMNESAKTNLAFFESYFSNYIEGTKFEVEEAVDIVFNGNIPEDRAKDAHDVLGVYRIVADYTEMARIPRDFETFLSHLLGRHATFMEARPDKKPGQFKTKNNQAGLTVFVAPDLLQGTLEKGFEIYRGIETPLHRAVFMMFLVSEVHPFVDGNGRTGRIMMNAELVAGGEQKIIIPTVYRNNYLSSLKTLSQSGESTPLIRVLDFAQKYTNSIRWGDFSTARADLQITNAFEDANEADSNGIRIMLPKDVSDS